MKRVTTTMTACALALLAVVATHVQGQESNTSERTFMTFSSPVELPGVTLDAGTYEFRLADSPSRNVVQVFRKDSRDVMGQWTFVQASRPRVSSETVVMFREAKEGGTPAVQFWYFPNESIGKEFIYPKDQAARIAARTGESVLTDDGRVNAPASAAAAARSPEPEPRDEAPARAEASEREARAEPPAQEARAEASVEAAEPQPQARPAPAPSPRPVGTSGVESQAPAQQERAAELPRTASPLALTGLVGLLSLAGAFGVRALRR